LWSTQELQCYRDIINEKEDWNIRTLLDNEDRPECHTTIIAHEMERYNIDIAAFSETRLSGFT